MNHEPDNVTVLLDRVHQGDSRAVDELLPVVYTELRNIARRQRFSWRSNETMNTTGLVHEAYFKLVRADGGWEGRAHFMRVAAKAMRQVLMDYVRAKKAQKRGGEAEHVSIDSVDLVSEEEADIFEALHDAIEELGSENPRMRDVIECRFFGGMTLDETATALGISRRSVVRSWSVAKVWLYDRLKTEVE